MKMKRHFRKRIVHYIDDRYIVQYAYYNYIVKWYTIEFWFECGINSGLESWTPKLFRYEDAVLFAKTLNSYKDVLHRHITDQYKEADFHKRKREYIAKVTPVQSEEVY